LENGKDDKLAPKNASVSKFESEGGCWVSVLTQSGRGARLEVALILWMPGMGGGRQGEQRHESTRTGFLEQGRNLEKMEQKENWGFLAGVGDGTIFGGEGSTAKKRKT